jgi:hypothetical protein
MSCIRCSGSSFACAALGCERAGDVNQLCMGAVMGRSVRWKLCEAVSAEEAAACAAARGRAEAGDGLWLGMGGYSYGYTTTTVSTQLGNGRMVREQKGMVRSMFVVHLPVV